MTDQAKSLPETAATDKQSAATEPQATRRRALARLGLASLAVYAAPTVLKIDSNARAGLLPPECVPPPDFPPELPPLCP